MEADRVSRIINLQIDRQDVSVNEGTTILEAAAAAGIIIPTLCYHKALGPSGFCRLCIVEIDSKGKKRLITSSCNCEVQEGMEVYTSTDSIKEMRRIIVDLMISGTTQSPELKKMRTAGSRFHIRNKDDCILCGLCVKACRQIIKACALEMDTLQGDTNRVAEYVRFNEDSCIGCGACASLCPVGAIKVRDGANNRKIVLYGSTVKTFELLCCSFCGRSYTTREHRSFVLSRVDEDIREKLRNLCPECSKLYYANSLAAMFPIQEDLP